MAEQQFPVVEISFLRDDLKDVFYYIYFSSNDTEHCYYIHRCALDKAMKSVWLDHESIKREARYKIPGKHTDSIPLVICNQVGATDCDILLRLLARDNYVIMSTRARLENGRFASEAKGCVLLDMQHIIRLC